MLSPVAFRESAFMLQHFIASQFCNKKACLYPTSPFNPSVLELVFWHEGYFQICFHPRFGFAVAHVHWAALWGRMAGNEQWWALFIFWTSPAPASGHRARAKWILPVITFKTLSHSSLWSKSQTEAWGWFISTVSSCVSGMEVWLKPSRGVESGMQGPRTFFFPQQNYQYGKIQNLEVAINVA